MKAKIWLRDIFQTLGGDLEDFRALCIRGLAQRENGYVLAVDFDGTLCESKYPGIGYPRRDVIADVLLCSNMGIKVVLWTCREGERLQEALDWCENQGLVFDAVNDNIPERKAYYNNDPRKIGYDELWDDRAVNV